MFSRVGTGGNGSRATALHFVVRIDASAARTHGCGALCAQFNDTEWGCLGTRAARHDPSDTTMSGYATREEFALSLHATRSASGGRANDCNGACIPVYRVRKCARGPNLRSSVRTHKPNLVCVPIPNLNLVWVRTCVGLLLLFSRF